MISKFMNDRVKLTCLFIQNNIKLRIKIKIVVNKNCPQFFINTRILKYNCTINYNLCKTRLK